MTHFLRDAPALCWDFVSAVLVAAVIAFPSKFSVLTVGSTVYGLLLLEPLAATGVATIGHGLRKFGLGWRTYTVAAMFSFVVILLSWIIEAGAEVPGLFWSALWLYAGKLSEGWRAGGTMKRRGELLFGVGVLTWVVYVVYLLAMIAVAKHYGLMVRNERGEMVVDRHSIAAALCGAGYFVLLGVGRIALRRRVDAKFA